jgi:hypothetical protein
MGEGQDEGKICKTETYNTHHMKKVFDYFWNTPTGNKLLMGKAFLIFTIVVYGVSYKYVNHVSTSALTQINYVDTIETKGMNLTFQHQTNRKILFLENQYKVAGQLKNASKEVATQYFKNYYAFTVCFTLFSAFLSVSVFLVGHKGWQHADDKLKTFLMLSIIFSSFFYFMPKVMNNEQNMYTTIEKQRAFQGIQLDILSFVNSGDTTRADSMVNRVDNAIKRNYGFMILIDPSAVGNPIDQLNTAMGNTNTAPSTMPPESQQKWSHGSSTDKAQKGKGK